MVADMKNVHPVETTHSSAELATFAIAYSTAENMLNRAGVGESDTVLIPGASGGVGSALVQLANRRGARTIAMASPAKHEEVSRLNPAKILPRKPDDLAAVLASEKISVVADIVGGDQFPALIEVLQRGGRYACSGAIAGPIVELDLRTFYLNDLTFHGCTIFEPKVFPALVKYIEAGEIRPMLAASFPLEKLHNAQRAFIEKKHTGNIVVTMD
jgi:NADPH:quinone reductase-like Zn-dependent oxidoreductase